MNGILNVSVMARPANILVLPGRYIKKNNCKIVFVGILMEI
jgi:hypothetical protein